MKTALIILSSIAIAVIILYFILAMISRSGNTPGLVDGKLKQCSAKSNCICSEYEEDVKHYITPIRLSQSTSHNPSIILKKVILVMEGNIETESDSYIAVTFTSSFFGFVDDLEIRIDQSHDAIHVRSASRVGYSDRGVNKKRVELLKELYFTFSNSDDQDV